MRPKKTLITKEKAAIAALEIIDDKGLAALSLNKVAEKLGVKAPSLLYHFKNKAELLSEVGRILLVVPSGDEVKRALDWRESMVRYALWTRNSLMRHPNAAPLLLEIFPERVMLPSFEFWVKEFDISDKYKMVVLEGLEKMTCGAALLGATSRAQGISAYPELDDEQFPNLSRVIRANNYTEEDIFEDAIRRFLSTF